LNNWWPFSGDIYLLWEINSLIKKFGIKTIIETGTWKGRTAQLMSTMADTVYTIEIDEEVYNTTNFLDDIPNVHRLLGDSPKVMDEILAKVTHPTLFFLDAHWEDNWPLLEELNIISKHKLNDSVIVIHDIYNPTKPDFHYDSYKGVRLDWDYIRPLITKIYSNYYYYYNNETSGDKCGAIFIHGDI